MAIVLIQDLPEQATTEIVDNKVAAIDDTWSGLRLVIRRELR